MKLSRKLHRFFISGQNLSPDSRQPISVDNPHLAHQLKNVFRLKAGDTLIFLDNSGFEFTVRIELLTREQIMCTIISSQKSENIPKQVAWLFYSITKKDTFEWVVEKGTELGVSAFVPVLAERTEKKAVNMERLKKIITEASEQSERGILPELFELLSFEDIFTFAKERGIFLIALHPQGERFDTKIRESITAKNQSTPVGLLIGPEGGWSEKETALFQANSISSYSLGCQILRAETAAIAISSLLLL